MYTAILKKEFRQHRTLMLACIGFCLCMHCFFYCTLDAEFLPLGGQLLMIAFYTSFFYVMSAAACVYAAEHDEKSFGFLRQLPVSPKTIALGKVSWVLASSGIVIASVLLSAWFWYAWLLGDILLPLKHAFSDVSVDVSVMKGTGVFLFLFVEVFLWGLFWTTRFHRQTLAVLATFLCLVGVFALLEVLSDAAVIEENYFLIHLIISAVVAVLALRGMLHWFDPEKKRSFLLRSLTEHRVLFRYPKQIQSPFFALFRQHIQAASVIYFFGLFCFALTIFLCIYLSFVKPSMTVEALYDMAWQVSGFGIVLFWGTIFGADQKNHSYRLLMRLGIHEGMIWWSRMTIPLLCYLPVLFAGLFYAHSFNGNTMEVMSAYTVAVCLWLAPVALGSYFSIFCHRQTISVVLTIGGSYILLLWAVYCAFRFEMSPLLSTLPICIAFLVASRLRVKYWLRDKSYWDGLRETIAKTRGVHQVRTEAQS